MGDDVEGAFVAEGRTDALENARNGLHIVRENLGLGFANGRDVLGLAGEVGNQELHPGVRVELMDLAHRFGVEPDALIFEVIACNTRDGGIAQVHLDDGLGNLGGLEHVDGRGLAGVDLAEVAAAGAF